MTLFLRISAVLFWVPFVCASLPTRSLNDSCTLTLDASSCPSHNRTLWDILLSCGLTLFACTWTAIHTNIPGMEGVLAVASRRLFIMVVALIAPELMITWATRQFFSARRAAKDFNTDFGTQRAHTYGNLFNRTMISLGDISGSSRAPRPAQFPGWRTYTYSSDGRYMSGSTATSLSDISETSVRSSTPRPADFQEWRLGRTNRFFGYDQDMSEIARTSGSSESSAPRPADFQEWRLGRTNRFFGYDRDMSESARTSGSSESSARRPAEFRELRMARGFFGNDRDISEVMEAREDLSAPRPAEFKG
ncbi:hypothetical protein EDD22DRAFT_167025 [Suillus occidentalis]|nr:hypothetical protein EDD22DRAFT_167025 [Suillus occidentalis]